MPYLKQKLDEAHEKLTGGAAAHIFGSLFDADSDRPEKEVLRQNHFPNSPASSDV